MSAAASCTTTAAAATCCMPRSFCRSSLRAAERWPGPVTASGCGTPPSTPRSATTRRVAREFQVNLPAELPPLARLALARAFARELAERYKVAVDLAVHAPRPEGDPRNFHAHLLATTREVTPDRARRQGRPRHGGARAAPARAARSSAGIHERARTLGHRSPTTALREANIDARVDHRSLAAQGIDREPTPAHPARCT